MSERVKLTFKPKSPEVEVIRAWWVGLNDDRGGRAALRRCHSPEEAAFVPAYQRLYWGLAELGTVYNKGRLEAFAALAARVEVDVAGVSLPKQFATSAVGTESGPALSELRFRRLLQQEAVEDLFSDLRRALALLNNKANLQDLAQSLVFWGERERKRWAYAYYEAANLPKKT